MFDIDNVRRMYKFVFVKSNLTLICNWYSMIMNRYYSFELIINIYSFEVILYWIFY